MNRFKKYLNIIQEMDDDDLEMYDQEKMIRKGRLIEKFARKIKGTEFEYEEFFIKNENYIYFEDVKKNSSDEPNQFIIVAFESSSLKKSYYLYYDNEKAFYEGESHTDFANSLKQKEEAYENLLSKIESNKTIIIKNKEKIFKLDPIRIENDENEDYY
jgi:hypothetical protein